MRLCSVVGCGRKHRTGGYCDMHAQRMRHTRTVDDGPKAPGTLADRFWRHVDVRSKNQCWEWTGATRSKIGYGHIQEGGKGSRTVSAHRVSYVLHYGQIPNGLIVMHKCDNPGCVNPEHLMLGTHKANIHDMIRKGRRIIVAPLGIENGKAVLNETMVREIRASTEPHAVIARRLGVSSGAVRGVRNGRTWKHIS